MRGTRKGGMRAQERGPWVAATTLGRSASPPAAARAEPGAGTTMELNDFLRGKANMATTSPVHPSVTSLAPLFLERVKTSPDKEAFRHVDGGQWVSVSWRQAADRVEALAAGLIALGVEPDQRIGIASSTRYEWILADLAVMCAGAAATTVYANTNAVDTAYILADSESRVVFPRSEGTPF